MNRKLLTSLCNHTVDHGEDVVIEIMRDGMRMQLIVPRGPLGISGVGVRSRMSNRGGG